MPRIRTESSRLRDPVVEKRFPTLAKGDDLVFVPLGYESGYAYPLLVWLPETSTAATAKFKSLTFSGNTGS